MADLCTDNRFELIEKYKQMLIDATNIETDPQEMAVIDNILFRFWQMGWLDRLDAEPVKRGHWEYVGGNLYRCSECHEGTADDDNILTGQANYCGVCGARMNEATEDALDNTN